jgi:hypothetical protein
VSAVRPWVRACVTAGLLAWGCAAPGGGEGPDAAGQPESTELLAGAALEQHRRELESARESMREFRRALEDLARRRDPAARKLFWEFADAYLGLHLDPALRATWQRTRDPELVVASAELGIVRAELLLRMGERQRAREALDDLESRFAGSERMLISYPDAEPRTFEEAMRIIRGRRWGTR